MIRIVLAAAVSVAALTAGQALADIRIAVAGPMSGALAAYGTQLRQGAEAAAAAINQAGGINGEKIAIVIEDDACEPKQAVAVAHRIVAAGVKLVAGHFCSGSTLPASDVYAEAGIVELTVSTSPRITERGLPYLFRLTGRDDQQGPLAAQFIAKRFAGQPTAVLDDKSPFGAGLARLVKEDLTRAGQPIAFVGAVNAGEKDYTALVSHLKAARVRVLFFGGYHAEAGLILRQADAAGLDLIVVGGDGLQNSDLPAIAGPLADRVYFTFSPDATRIPAAAAVVRRLGEQGITAEGYTLYAYAQVQVLAEGVRRAGGQNGAAVAKALRSAPVPSIVGDIAFDAKGDNSAPGYVLYRWAGGKTEAVTD